MTLGPERLTATSLASVPHGFLGRRGGVSTGDVAGLNCGIGSSDDPDLVQANRRIAAEAVLPGATLVGLYQIHSALAVEAGDWAEAERPQADALVTNRKGVLLGILTADCAPVLLADADAGVVAAAHAGWKGAFHGVTDATVALMEQLGARRDRIVAAIGPCIAQPSYEVDAAFRTRFTEAEPEHQHFFKAGREGHWQFALEAYVAHRLERAGIGAIECLEEDTYSQPERYFSFRRATHRHEPGYGRQISLIGLD